MTPASLATADAGPGQELWRSRARIPIRSLWALLVYAHDLARFTDPCAADAEDAAELSELLARLLCEVVERRLRRNLSRAYRPRAEVLNRVRGRIDWLKTETGLLLSRGEVACRYEELTPDTPRNRLVRFALEACAAAVSDSAVAHRCRTLARDLSRLGVGAGRPSRSALATDQIARHDAEDRLMVSAALLALDLVLPAEHAGDTRATRLQRDEELLAKIFEAAVAGVYRHHLHGDTGVTVSAQSPWSWPVSELSAGMAGLMPGLRPDLVISRPESGGERKRLVIDTKFTGMLTRNQFGADRLKSAHLYQMYAYLRSQEDGSVEASHADGLLLHPSIDVDMDEHATIQGHRIRFATVDLSAKPTEWRDQLLLLTTEHAAIGGKIEG